MKNFKTFYENQIVNCLEEIITLPPTRTKKKLPTSREQTFSYEDMQEYTDICFPSALRMQFLCI